MNETEYKKIRDSIKNASCKFELDRIIDDLRGRVYSCNMYLSTCRGNATPEDIKEAGSLTALLRLAEEEFFYRYSAWERR